MYPCRALLSECFFYACTATKVRFFLYMSEFCSTFVADLTYIQCMTVSAKAELKGNPVQIRDSPAAVNSCHRFNNMSLPQGGKTLKRGISQKTCRIQCSDANPRGGRRVVSLAATRMAFGGVEPLDSFLEREEMFLFYNTFRCLPNNNVL